MYKSNENVMSEQTKTDFWRITVFTLMYNQFWLEAAVAILSTASRIFPDDNEHILICTNVFMQL